jgi:nucleotide-binding universal stress UspA family protein
MKILLAADGSPFTTKAAKYIATHFDLFGAGTELHVLNVKPPIPAGLAVANASRILGKGSIDKYYREEAEAALKPAERILRKAAVPFHSSYKIGSIADEVVAFARKNKVDMIVMGSHGHGALVNVLMGSVATRVLAASTVPVLVIR